MKFHDISDESTVAPGEYLLYVPKNSIVLCGAFDGTNIRALENGALFEDKVENFKKITLTQRERKRRYVSRCKGCGS